MRLTIGINARRRHVTSTSCDVASWHSPLSADYERQLPPPLHLGHGKALFAHSRTQFEPGIGKLQHPLALVEYVHAIRRTADDARHEPNGESAGRLTKRYPVGTGAPRGRENSI